MGQSGELLRSLSWRPLHVWVRCPGPGDDNNNDGYVDWQETQQVVGTKLLSLDANISSVEESGYPHGANYRYSRKASISDLRSILPPGENLNFDGRVLVIYGATLNYYLRPSNMIRKTQPTFRYPSLVL